jgi:hypothetical protein
MPRLQLYLRAADLDALVAAARARGQLPSRFGKALVVKQLTQLHVLGSPERARSGPNGHDAPRVRQIGVRVSQLVFERLASIAAEYGETPGGLVARLMSSAIESRPVLRAIDLDAFHDCIEQLCFMGNNLNQIAHHLNSAAKGHRDADDRQVKLDALLDCLEAVRSASAVADRVLAGAWQACRATTYDAGGGTEATHG